MSLDFVSGLLLAMLTLAVLAYAAKQLLGDYFIRLEKPKEQVAEALAKHLGGEAKPVNDHLIGSTGKVIAISDDSTAPMRVRLALEIWPARLASAKTTQLSVGTAIKVTYVDGPVLIVESTDPSV